MLSVGSNIKSSSEPLKKASIEYLYHALLNPKPQLASKIEQLRIVRQVSPGQYAQLKQQLPFFVCASFNPPIRRTENFAFTEFFVVDIDHIGDKGLSVSNLKSRIAADPRTLLCFVSPGQDGLKILMRLSSKCYDPGIYSVFYKKFVYEFSLQYSLQQVIDAKTCDVARACFMSVDPDAYYNSDAEPVDIEKFLPLHDTSQLLTLKKEVESNLSEISKSAQSVDSGQTKPAEPDDEAMATIRAKLDIKMRNNTKEKIVFVPEVLNDIIADVIHKLKEFGLDVYDVINISYGKKIRARLGRKLAEINLFYSIHRGFTVVISPRTGTDPDLNNILADAVRTSIEP